MELKTYRASTMHDALAMVRHDLGPDAAVLHTREVQGSWLFGLMHGPTQIEVTASRGVNVPSRLPGLGNPTRESRGKDRDKDRGGRDEVVLRHDGPHKLPVGPVSRFPYSPPEAMQNQLSELQNMVHDLRRRGDTPRHELPELFFQLFTELLDADLCEDLARELVERVRKETQGAHIDDLLLLKARLARSIEADLHTCGPIQIMQDRCRLVALVGPTGVGKTTTIAKLAANYHLKEKRRVGLITVDTYRVAAVEQLRTFADIIDLPMQVVSTPREMREAVRRMDDLDLILLDTAGRSPKDEVRIQELRAFLTEADADEVHLVLSSVATTRVLEQTAERFAAVGTTALILTKLDEAAGFGNILPLVRACNLPLSYLTNGQNVPDDIEVAEAARIARMILGMEEEMLARAA